MFAYYAPYHIMICTSCRYVVFDNQLSRHLRRFHVTPTGPQFALQDVLKYYQKFPNRTYRTDDLMFPSEIVPAIPGLPIEPKSFQCRVGDCRWVGTSIRRWWDHNCQRHGHPKAPAPRSLSEEIPCTGPVCSQQFIKVGRGADRFVVHSPESSPSTTPESTDCIPWSSTTAVVEDAVAPELPNSFQPAVTSSASQDAMPPSPTPPTHTAPSITVVIASENGRRESSSPSMARGHSPDAMGPPLASSGSSSRSLTPIEAAVGAWGDGCPLCQAKKVRVASPHSLSRCQQRLAPTILTQGAAIQALCPSEQGSRPYYMACLLLVSVCDRFRPAQSYESRSLIEPQCQHLGLVIQTVLSVCSYNSAVIEQILGPSMERDGISLEDQESSFRWFITEKALGGLCVPNITHCFYQIYQFYTAGRKLPPSKSQARDRRRRPGS